MHGYDWPQNKVYETPTTHRNVVVAYNRIYDAKKHFEDGGANYNLSASRRTVIAENHIFDLNRRIAPHLDQGSKYITVREIGRAPAELKSLMRISYVFFSLQQTNHNMTKKQAL